jgi:cell wall-associated NlpC family hydrolase
VVKAFPTSLPKTKASREGGPIVFRSESAFLCADVAPAAFRLSAAAAVGSTATSATVTATATAAAVAATTSTTVAATAAAVTTTTATAGTASTAAATAKRTATAAATSTRRTILGRIHAEGAAAQIVSIELFDRFRRIFIRFEFDERESAGPSRLAIGRKKHVSYRSDLRKQRFDLVARCVEVEIPYENLGSHQHLLFCG